MRLVSVSAQLWHLPLHAPFSVAQRTAYEAQNVLVSVFAEGEAVPGRGESAPVSYVTGETTDTVLDAIRHVAPLLAGLDIDRLLPLWDVCARELGHAPAARAGLETALFDLWARHWNLPLWQHFGGAQSVLTTDVTIPIVPPAEAALLASAAGRDGFRHLKIKVGGAGGPAEDLARVEAVVRACPGARLRIDANQAFDVDGAVSFMGELTRMNAQVELLEQPVPKDDWQGLKAVRASVPVPVFADEAACSPADVLRLLREDAVDGVNIKLQKSGLAGAFQIISLCRAAGVNLMLGCMLESEIGITAAATMAGGTGAFDFLDLDSHRLLRPVPGLSGGFDVEGGTFRLHGDAPGWGTSLQEETARAGNKEGVGGD